MFIISFISAVLIASVSQVLLKISANREHESHLKEYLNRYVILGYFLFVFSTVLVILGYKGLPLKAGPILESIGYVFVLILSSFIFKDKITKNTIIGTVLIICGIIVFNI